MKIPWSKIPSFRPSVASGDCDRQSKVSRRPRDNDHCILESKNLDNDIKRSSWAFVNIWFYIPRFSWLTAETGSCPTKWYEYNLPKGMLWWHTWPVKRRGEASRIGAVDPMTTETSSTVCSSRGIVQANRRCIYCGEMSPKVNPFRGVKECVRQR